MKRNGLVTIAAMAGILLIGATAFAGCCGGYGQGSNYQSGYGPGNGSGPCCSFGAATVNGPARNGLPSCCRQGGQYAYQAAGPHVQPGPGYSRAATAVSAPARAYRPQVKKAYAGPQARTSYSNTPLRVSQNAGPAYGGYPRAVPASNSSLPPCCQVPQQSARKLW